MKFLELLLLLLNDELFLATPAYATLTHDKFFTEIVCASGADASIQCLAYGLPPFNGNT